MDRESGTLFKRRIRKIENANILVVGPGVGSFAEFWPGLEQTIVDGDVVDTNINDNVHRYIDSPKITIVGDRLMDINPTD
jgi:tRNA A37 threonylcarbamoyladenosine dehydratase